MPLQVSNQFDENEPAKLLITSPKNSVNLISPIQFSKGENDFKPQCHWNNWSSWSDCTITCGDHAGTRRRVRSQRGSKFCSRKQEIEEKICSPVNKCPIDCAVGMWSSWSHCSQTCGTGEKSRTRNVVREPKYGGKKCSLNQNDFVENVKCAIGNCSVDGSWSGWSRWSYCDASCGKGKRTRQRNCDSPKPENGGLQCEGTGLFISYDVLIANQDNINLLILQMT